MELIAHIFLALLFLLCGAAAIGRMLWTGSRK
jgi:hypothetical protein